MKIFKCFSVLLMLMVSLTFTGIKINAQENRDSIVEMREENGFTIVTIITENMNDARINQKNGSKTVNYYDGNTLLWSVSVHGTFSYSTNSVSCISAYATGSSSHPSWEVKNLSAWRSGSTAYASGVGTKSFLGVTIQNVSRTVSLNCSSTGVLS